MVAALADAAAHTGRPQGRARSPDGIDGSTGDPGFRLKFTIRATGWLKLSSIDQNLQFKPELVELLAPRPGPAPLLPTVDKAWVIVPRSMCSHSPRSVQLAAIMLQRQRRQPSPI
jgi:hypothetical protein